MPGALAGENTLARGRGLVEDGDQARWMQGIIRGQRTDGEYRAEAGAVASERTQVWGGLASPLTTRLEAVGAAGTRLPPSVPYQPRGHWHPAGMQP